MGNIRTVVDPQTNNQAFVDELHDLRASPLIVLAGTTFVGGTLDTSFWTSTLTAAGTVTQASGVLTLTTGVTSNGTAQYQSVQTARWLPQSTNTFSAQVKLADTGTTNNTRNWGAFNPSGDGFYFQITGTTVNIVSIIGGSATAVAAASWNKQTFTMDTNYHVYEIRYNGNNVRYYIDGILRHELDITTALFAGTMNLPITIQNNNAGGSTTNVSMACSVATVIRTGQPGTEKTYKHIAGATAGTVCKLGAGRLHLMVIGGAGTTVTLFDNTAASGTTISVVTPASTTTPTTIWYDLPFYTGLAVVVVGAASDITLVYE